MAGDVDGDGYGDVIVGAPEYGAGEPGEGAVFVFLGGASGVAHGSPATAAAQLEADQTGAAFGATATGVGDVNGDGYADVIVGAPEYDAVEADEGAAFVFLGSAAGIADGSPATAAAQLESDQPSAQLGWSVDGAGDTNGDGYADVITGALGYDGNLSNESVSFVFLGNGNLTGRAALARQRRGDGSETPVQPWGHSKSVGSFVAELRASHPEGSGRVRVELEACPSGVAFADAGCTSELSAAGVDVDGLAPEALISHTFGGLTDETLHHWRARVLHAPATGPLPAEPAHGPWRRFCAQSVEADIRLPEPGLPLALAGGAALLAALARRRKARRE